MRPSAILFDLDDTLISSHWHRTLFWNKAVCEIWGEAHGQEAPLPADLEALVAATNRSARHFWSDPVRHKTGRLDISRARYRILDDGLGEDERFDAAVRFAISERCGALITEFTSLYPDAIETLEGLQAEGIAMALITNGAAEPQRAKIERFALARYFDHIQIEGEAGVGKPEPEAYRRALVALDASPANTWMVGDNLEWEVAAPQALGIHAIWRDPTGRGILPDNATVRPDRILTQLPTLLA